MRLLPAAPASLPKDDDTDRGRGLMELYILPLGTCCCNYEVVAPGVADGQRIHIPVPAYLIRLDDGSLVLVDTGMNRIHIKDPDYTWRGQPVADVLVPDMRREDSLLWRLAELDIAPADIDYVINTHLHFDHAGNNDLLKDAKFFVQREHYEFAKDNPSFPNEYWNLPGLSYELVDGAATLFPGVEVIPTPGQRPGAPRTGRPGEGRDGLRPRPEPGKDAALLDPVVPVARPVTERTPSRGSTRPPRRHPQRAAH
jgi:glyoxylase-like metal-dependent hydrolase (beta-lactamase superfamily II)